MFAKLWKDEAGAVISAELVFILTILVIGLVAGWVNLENAIKVELSELANAILALNQGFGFSGQSNCKGFSAGSLATDTSATTGFVFTAPTSPSTVNVAFCP